MFHKLKKLVFFFSQLLQLQLPSLPRLQSPLSPALPWLHLLPPLHLLLHLQTDPPG